MPTFRYEAVDAAGNTVRGTVNADTRESAIQKMRDLRYQPISIEVGREQSKNLASLNNRFQSIKLKELVVFTRQFATMIDAGLPILKCLDILAVQTRNSWFRESIQAIKLDIASGTSLADSLAKHPRIFNDLYVNMIRAAELGGILDTILARIATHLEDEQEIRTKVKSAMMYPCVVFAFALLMTIGIVFLVLPRFKEIFTGLVGPDYRLPKLTAILLNSGAIGKQYWYVPVLLIVGSVAGLRVLGRTESGRYRIDSAKLRIPIVGDLLLKLAVARVCRTLGTLLSSGIPIIRALDIVRETAGNAVVGKAIADARTAVHEGHKFCEPLQKSKVFPLMTTQMIQVGEEVGRIDEMLTKIAVFYEDEVDAIIKGLTSLIEPLMIIGLGAFVGFVAVAVLKPIYDVLQQMQDM
jgi:type IV pilus assembly protein PilC